MVKALVVGGTGPTGPFLVQGLLERGYEVSILHRGTHEVPEIPPEVEHIHTDPHFRETLQTSLIGRRFDLVVATYGRLRVVAEVMSDKTPRFIGIGGNPVYRGMFVPERNFPTGMKVPLTESAPVAQSEADGRLSYLVAKTEADVMQGHHDGKYNATYFRYPLVYGPYQVSPPEWCVIRRILDRRPFMILPDGGLTLGTRGYAANLAHAVLLAVDQPEVSAGQVYNCGDEGLLSIHQWVELIAHTLEYEWELISLPAAVAHPSAPLLPLVPGWYHCVQDLTKIRTELGYRDVMPIEEALPQVVRWYVEHPPERGGVLEKALNDPFDYAAEDRLVTAYRACLDQLQEIPFERSDDYHPYAHPRRPGQQDHRQR